MIKAYSKRIILAGLLGAVLCLTGCLDAQRSIKESAPGKATLDLAIEALETHAANITAMHAIGQCHMSFFDEEGRRRVHNISYNLRLDPPFNVYLQGQAAPGRQGLISMGSNAEEFWLSIRLDINTYWWGRWVDVQENLPLKLSPQVILESLGIIHFDHPGQWRLTHQPGTDVLTERDPNGRPVKRIRVSTADYLLRNVTYFDEEGAAAVVVDLGVYTYRGGLLLPTEIHMANYAEGKVTDSANFSIRDAMTRQYDPDQFKRRQPQGYDNVWRFTAHGFVEDQ